MLFLTAPWAYRTKICILFLPRDNFYFFIMLKPIQFLPNTISTGVLSIEIRKDHAVKGETNCNLCMELYLKGRAKRAENFWDTISTKLIICTFFSPRIDTISTKHYFYRRAERAWEKYVTISTNTTISTFFFLPKRYYFSRHTIFPVKLRNRF